MTDFCISQYLFGFCILDRFQRGFTENTIPSCKRANELGWLDFFYNSVAFCRQRVVKPKVNYTASLVVSKLFPQATLLIRRRLTHNLLLADLYLECGYEDLRCIRNKTNMP